MHSFIHGHTHNTFASEGGSQGKRHYKEGEPLLLKDATPQTKYEGMYNVHAKMYMPSHHI
jgi:hypothetical protein